MGVCFKKEKKKKKKKKRIHIHRQTDKHAFIIIIITIESCSLPSLHWIDRANLPIPMSKTLRLSVRCEAGLPGLTAESPMEVEPKFSIQLFNKDYGGIYLTSNGRIAIEQDYIRISQDSYARVGVEVRKRSRFPRPA